MYKLGTFIESTKYENVYGTVVSHSGIPATHVQIQSPDKRFYWLLIRETQPMPDLGVICPDGTIVPQTEEWSTDTFDAVKAPATVRWVPGFGWIDL